MCFDFGTAAPLKQVTNVEFENFFKQQAKMTGLEAHPTNLIINFGCVVTKASIKRRRLQLTEQAIVGAILCNAAKVKHCIVC